MCQPVQFPSTPPYTTMLKLWWGWFVSRTLSSSNSLWSFCKTCGSVRAMVPAAAKSLQSCPTLCNHIHGSPPGPCITWNMFNKWIHEQVNECVHAAHPLTFWYSKLAFANIFSHSTIELSNTHQTAYARVSKTNNAGHWLRWWKQILFNNYPQSGKELNSILMCAKMTGNFKRNRRE